MRADSSGLLRREIALRARRFCFLFIAGMLATASGTLASSQTRSADPTGLPTVLRGAGPGIQISPAPNGAAVLRGTGPDPRELVDMNEAPWRAVGKVVAIAGGLRNMCTGSLIDPDRVLTAAHCLYNFRSHEYFVPGATQFLLGSAGDKFVASARAISFAVGPLFDPENIDKVRGSDWAIIKLDHNLAGPDQTLPVDSATSKAGTPIVIGGYSYDRALYVTADTHCEILADLFDASGEPLLFHNCTAKQGASGAPVLVFAQDHWIIRGVDVATSRQNTRGVAAIPLRPGDQPFDPRAKKE
jgi:protease YdgD